MARFFETVKHLDKHQNSADSIHLPDNKSEDIQHNATSDAAQITSAFSGDIAEIKKQLARQAQKLEEHIANQEAKQRDDDVQRMLDAKKQRRQEWLIAIVSAALATIFPFLLQGLKELFLLIWNFFH